MKPHNLNGLDACVFLSLFQCDAFYSINEKKKTLFLFKHFRPLWPFHWQLRFRVVVSAPHYMIFLTMNKKKSYICFDANSTEWIETISIFFLFRLLVKVVDWSVDTFRFRPVVLLVRFGNSSLFYMFIISILCDFLFDTLFWVRFLCFSFHWSFTFQQKKTLQTKDTWTINSFDFGQLFSSMSDYVQSENCNCYNCSIVCRILFISSTIYVEAIVPFRKVKLTFPCRNIPSYFLLLSPHRKWQSIAPFTENLSLIAHSRRDEYVTRQQTQIINKKENVYQLKSDWIQWRESHRRKEQQ